MDRLENVVFLDTVPLDGIPSSATESTNSAAGESAFTFSGLNVNDPAVTAITISSPHHGSTSNSDISGVQPSIGNDVHAISKLLQAEAVDVVLYVTAPGDIEPNVARNVKSTLTSGTLPVLVVNKVDNVWDDLYASAKGDEDFLKDYASWKERMNAQNSSALNIPGELTCQNARCTILISSETIFISGLSQFYVSTTRDSSINGVGELEGFISQLVKHRKTIKSLTGIKHLDSVASSYLSVVNSHINELKEVQVFFDEVLRIVEDRVDLASREMRHLFAGAVIKALYAALRDVGLDDVIEESGSESIGAFTSNNAKFLTFNEAQNLNSPYLMARCLELGLGVTQDQPILHQPSHTSQSNPSRPSPTSARRQHPLASSFSAPNNEPNFQSADDVNTYTDAEIRFKAIKLYNESVEQLSKTPPTVRPDLSAAKSTLRLSHLFRPSSQLPAGDSSKSSGYLRKAAQMGLATAQMELARALEIGDCENVDLTHALKWYQAAAESGDPEAALEMARFTAAGLGGLQSNADAAVSWLMRAAGGVSGSLNAPRTSTSIAAVIGYEASIEIARCYFDGVGVRRDEIEAEKWQKEAERRWESVWNMLAKTMYNLMNSAVLMRTPYGLGSFVDRLHDQLRMHIAVVRTHLISSIKVSLPPIPPPPVGFEDPYNPESVKFAQTSEQKPTPFQNVQSLILHQLQATMNVWTSGNVDEETDIKEDPAADISSTLAEALQAAITVAIPGTAMTARIADAVVRYWKRQSEKFEILDEYGEDPTAVPDEDILMSPQQKVLHMEIDNSPDAGREEEDEGVATVGLAVVQFLKAVAQPGYVADSGSAKVFGGLLGVAWDTSVDRMLLEIQKVFEGFVEAVKKETRIWTKRQAWASSVTMECQSKMAAIKLPVLQSMLNSIAESRKTDTANMNPSTVSPTAEKAGDATWNGIEMARISQMPFVWGGATVIMSSQLLDEVTGSLHQVNIHSAFLRIRKECGHS
jgi:hypothetical protein